MDTVKRKVKGQALKVFGRLVRVGGAVAGWVQSEGIISKIAAFRDEDSDGGTNVTASEGLSLASDLTDEESIKDLRARIARAVAD